MVDIVINGICAGDKVRTISSARPRKYANQTWLVEKITPKRAILTLVVAGVRLPRESGYRYPNYWPIELIEKA